MILMIHFYTSEDLIWFDERFNVVHVEFSFNALLNDSINDRILEDPIWSSEIKNQCFRYHDGG